MDWSLLPIGLGIGALATMIGAGGGFLVVPILMFFFTEDKSLATGTSLGFIVINAVSGTIGYARQKLVDWKTAAIFSVAMVPSALLGKTINATLSPKVFQASFATLLLIIAINLLRKKASPDDDPSAPENGPAPPGARTLTDSHGRTFTYSISYLVGIPVCIMIGLLAGTFGIGGGFILVPAMVLLMGVPLRIAIPTGVATIVATAASGIIPYALEEHVNFSWVALLGSGALVGAPIGAWLGGSINPRILRIFLVFAILLSCLKLYHAAFTA